MIITESPLFADLEALGLNIDFYDSHDGIRWTRSEKDNATRVIVHWNEKMLMMPFGDRDRNKRWQINILASDHSSRLSIEESRMGGGLIMGKFVNDEIGLDKALKLVIRTAKMRIKELRVAGNDYYNTPEMKHAARGRISGNRFGF